jgi:NADPH:quinone reductase-like Zn-dependent oxidoreductase
MDVGRVQAAFTLSQGTPLKATIYHTYGSPDVLELVEIPNPIPRTDEVLVRVQAASVNSWDWDRLTGTPPVFRVFSGLLKPKLKILGADIAGRVEAVGRNVKRFQPGDEVFGDLCESGWGGFAEYVCAREDALALKPSSMTFEQAAAIPQAGVLALQGLVDKGGVQPGQQVLINGAGGGVGTFAVQIAKSFGAEVTGVDGPEKLDLMSSVGADHVVDYTQEDFTRNGQRYDLILDISAHHSMFDCKRALAPGGTYVLVGGAVRRVLQLLLLGSWLAVTGGKKMGILSVKPNEGLDLLEELFEAGKVVPVIDRSYTLAEVPEALRHLGEGRTRGKVVITV